MSVCVCLNIQCKFLLVIICPLCLTLWYSSMCLRWFSSQISRFRYSFQSAWTASMWAWQTFKRSQYGSGSPGTHAARTKSKPLRIYLKGIDGWVCTSITFFPGCSEATSFSPSSFSLVMVASLDSRHLLMKFCYGETDMLRKLGIIFYLLNSVHLCMHWCSFYICSLCVPHSATSYCLWRAG